MRFCFTVIDGASVYPREVVKRALANNSAALILTHNHPSGIAEPSQADIALTSRLKDALGLIDVRVLDHFIVGEGAPVSFSERGLMWRLREPGYARFSNNQPDLSMWKDFY